MIRLKMEKEFTVARGVDDTMARPASDPVEAQGCGHSASSPMDRVTTELVTSEDTPDHGPPSAPFSSLLLPMSPHVLFVPELSLT